MAKLVIRNLHYTIETIWGGGPVRIIRNDDDHIIELSGEDAEQFCDDLDTAADNGLDSDEVCSAYDAATA